MAEQGERVVSLSLRVACRRAPAPWYNTSPALRTGQRFHSFQVLFQGVKFALPSAAPRRRPVLALTYSAVTDSCLPRVVELQLRALTVRKYIFPTSIFYTSLELYTLQ